MESRRESGEWRQQQHKDTGYLLSQSVSQVMQLNEIEGNISNGFFMCNPLNNKEKIKGSRADSRQRCQQFQSLGANIRPTKSDIIDDGGKPVLFLSCTQEIKKLKIRFGPGTRQENFLEAEISVQLCH